MKVRSAVTTPEHRRDRMLFRAWSATWRHPLVYGVQRRAARAGLRLIGRRGWARRLPGPGAAWTDQRDLPTRWPPQ